MGLLLPGTTIEVSGYENNAADHVLSNIFAGGGIVLSQMCNLTGLEAHTVQNWVKRGFVSAPQHRLYSRRQFSRVVIINMLKDSMKIDRGVQLISYINGVMNREEDASIDVTELYTRLVNLLGALESGYPSREAVQKAASAILEDFVEQVPGSRQRIQKVLMVMVYAWLSAKAKQRAEFLMRDLF